MNHDTPWRMRGSRRTLAVLTSTWVLALGAPALAGVVFEVETTYAAGSRTGTESSRMSVQGESFKIETLPGDQEDGERRDEMIFRGDRRQMVVVDHEERSYVVVDGEAVQRLGGQMQDQMQQAMKELEKRLEGLDPKQREMMEKLLGGGVGGMLGKAAGETPKRPPAEFRDTGERATRAGYPCVRYDVLRAGERVRELWVTDWDNVEGGRQAAAAFEAMGGFFREMIDSFDDMLGGSGLFDGVNDPIESLAEVPGFPVVTRSFEDGELESEAVLRSVTERDLDPAAFEPPEGYRLKTMGPQ